MRLSQIARQHGINYGTLYSRIHRTGMSLEQAIEFCNKWQDSMHPLYRTWQGMMQRCYNPRSTGFKDYGGVGIVVCDEWKDFHTFKNQMPPRPSPEHSIDRFPNTGGNYEPGNVRWATKKQQQRNRRCSLTAFGRPLMDVIEERGLSRKMVYNRIVDRGWTPEEAVSTPLQKYTSQCLDCEDAARTRSLCNRCYRRRRGNGEALPPTLKRLS